MITFTSSQQLVLWLGEQGIDLERWGEGEAKSVADLWLEILNGETTLHESPPRRQVQVVELLIVRGEQALIEAMQELANGERRYRNHLPAEKIKRERCFAPTGDPQRHLVAGRHQAGPAGGPHRGRRRGPGA